MFLLPLLACSPVTLPGGDTETKDSDPVDTQVVHTGETGQDTGWTGEPLPWPSVEYDCSALPEPSPTKLDGARGYHGLAFDDQGLMTGWDAITTLMQTAYPDQAKPFLPGMVEVEQMVRHPAGHFFVLSAKRLYRVEPDGSSERLGNFLDWAYGLTLGPDGMLYISGRDLWRMDPDTEEVEVLLEGPGLTYKWLYRDVTFNADTTVMYIATALEGSNFIRSVELDEEMNLVGEPKLFAQVPGHWKDSLQIDACGYLWTPDFHYLALYRVSPDGQQVDQVLSGIEREYGHGVEWGNGVGGWREDAIYLPLPYDGAQVRELVTGIPDGRLVRHWKGEKSRY